MVLSRMKLIVDPGRCDGCRLCELVCSLRLHGEFSPSRSAIRVSKTEKRGIYTPVVSPSTGLLLDPEGKPLVCDLCDGSPRCVEICPNDAIHVREE
jgi:carbon-monoxide dehydrogenase iron sulfur subunit